MEQRNLRKERTGVVTGDKMQKSITVAVRRRFKHQIYGKYITKITKYIAHDEEDACKMGDTGFCNIRAHFLLPYEKLVGQKFHLPG